MEPEEIIEDIEPTQIEEDTEDTLEKFKAAKKRAEDELGITKDFNENDLRYEVLLEKMKLIAAESSEEFANMFWIFADFAALKQEKLFTRIAAM